MEQKKKKKFRINGILIFNIIVVALSVYLLIYFFVSEDGVIDLLSKRGSFSIFWVIVAALVYEMNVVIDSFVTLVYIRSEYKDFRFIDALKVSLVGVFFGAVTPSNTGGQPMQLFLLSKKNIRIGFGSACMTQKFIVYQIVTTVFSILAVIIKFGYFKSAFTNFWSTAFIILGFTVQLAVTGLFLIVSFSKKVSNKLVRGIYWIMKKLRFVKEPEHKIRKLKREIRIFQQSSKDLMADKKKLVKIYLLVILQVMLILSVPYFIYLSLDMRQITINAGGVPGNIFDFICIQSFVLFTSNLVPLPGASGGAELAFSMYFGQFFIIGGVNKIKPAILLWRLCTYYASIVVSAPFSYLTKGRNASSAKEELDKIRDAEYGNVDEGE